MNGVPLLREEPSRKNKRQKQVRVGHVNLFDRCYSLITFPNILDAALLSKKRKLEPAPAAAKPAQPVKKAAVGGPSATKPVVKKEPGATKTGLATVTVTKDAKADSSFFSAPKAKSKLPSFKKAPLPPPVKREADAASANMAMGSSFDPFQEALKSMKGRKDSPAAAPTPPPQSTSAEPQPGLMRNGRRKKFVTWAPDGQLEAIKFIEKAIYDDDPVDVSTFHPHQPAYYTLMPRQFSLFSFDIQGAHVAHSFRDMDRGEGNALHAQVFEETVDWSDPPRKPNLSAAIIDALIESFVPLSVLHFDAEPVERGANSNEKVVQEEREQSALGAVYMTPNQIPDSPAEPTNIIPDEEMQKELNPIPLGIDMEALLSEYWGNQQQQPVAPQVPPVPQGTVADLVNRLNMTEDTMTVDTSPIAAGGITDGSGFPIASQDLQALLDRKSVV